MTSIHRSHSRHRRHLSVKHHTKHPVRAAAKAATAAPAKARSWAPQKAAPNDGWDLSGARKTAVAAALAGAATASRSSLLPQTASTLPAGEQERTTGAVLRAPFRLQGTPPAAPVATNTTTTPAQVQPREGLPPLAHTGGLNDKAKQLVSASAELTQLAENAAPKLEGKKVLMLGDSHSADEGFGSRFDALLRASGAETHSIAKSNSKADWFINGTTGHWGETDRAANGALASANGLSGAKLDQILSGPNKPDVMVVALGANFRGQGEAVMKKQVDLIADRAKAAGVKLVWLGPPNSLADTRNGAAMKTFNDQMARALGDRGTYIPSSQFTPVYPSGTGDPEQQHYWKAGLPYANKWANGSFAAFTNAL